MIITYKSIDIIGGGIIGTILATELLREIRKRGLKTEVHLFERRGQLGMENTEKSFEGVRTYWFTPEEIRFYLTSIRAFQDLDAHFRDNGLFKESRQKSHGLTASYRQLGYHFFMSRDDFKNAHALEPLFREEDVPLAFYTKEEAYKIDWIRNNFDLDATVLNEDAWVDTHFDLNGWKELGFDLSAIIPNNRHKTYSIAGYVHVPVAGFISAGDVIASYRQVFELLGGNLHLNTEVLGVGTRGQRIETLDFRSIANSESQRISSESKSTDFVINTAGVWSEEINNTILGERLGITPHRRYPIIVKPPKNYQTDHGMVFLRQRVIRPDGDKIWLYFTVPNEKPGIEQRQPDDRLFDEYFFKYIYAIFCHHDKPFIRNAETLGLYGSVDSRGWLGHYADTPDERPMIGLPKPDKLENYAVSTGYSGRGVQASVAAALGLTHQVLNLDEPSTVKIPKIYAADRDLSLAAPDLSRF